jgi:4-hydroxybutyrate CoA-transferase
MAEPPGQQAGGDWREAYRRRVVTAEEAVSHIAPGDNVWISVGQPVGVLVAALLGSLEPGAAPIDVTWLITEDVSWYTGDFVDQIRLKVPFASIFSREIVNDFRADFLPWWVYGGHKAREEGRPGCRPIDVALIGVSPPNRWGYCFLGATLWDAKSTALKAKIVLAVVDENIPQTFGDTFLHVSEIDCFVEHTRPRPEMNWAYPLPDPWDEAIAHNVASLIKDGDTIQLGTGSTTGNIPRLGVLDEKHDLGYFGELTVPGTVDLVKKGVITSRRMDTHPGKFLTTTAGNSPADIDFIGENPMFEFYGPEYMHHPGIIGRNDNLVAVNNAVSVDLTGQIAAGQIGTRVWSGTGGQLSYAMGAYLSRGGRSITVLPSTARAGTVSRIVSQLDRGQVVTVPRDLADIVVSEFGVAHLLNKTQRQRAEELIAIAHPDFRAGLRKEAARWYGL